MSVTRLQHLNSKLTGGIPPAASAELYDAAKRATDRSNQLFRDRKTPFVASVDRRGERVVIKITTVGRSRRPVSGRTPEQVVAQFVEREMASARPKVAEAIARTLRS